jgi:hypothetical protein
MRGSRRRSGYCRCGGCCRRSGYCGSSTCYRSRERRCRSFARRRRRRWKGLRRRSRSGAGRRYVARCRGRRIRGGGLTDRRSFCFDAAGCVCACRVRARASRGRGFVRHRRFGLRIRRSGRAGPSGWHTSADRRGGWRRSARRTLVRRSDDRFASARCFRAIGLVHAWKFSGKRTSSGGRSAMLVSDTCAGERGA